MSIQIYRRQNNPNDAIAQAIIAGTNGFVQGRKLREDESDKSLANAYKTAQISELQRKSEALNQPAPSGYVRDPYSGALKEDLGNDSLPSSAASTGGPQPFIKSGKRVLKNPDYFSPNKPLSDTAATRLSAAQQSLGNIQTVREMATPDQFGEMKKGVSRIRIGNKLGVTNIESPVGNALNFMTMGAAKLPFQTTDVQKKFENNLSTLVESQLRARTGAAAPQQEVDREVGRILASDDSLKSFLSKLSNSEKFAIGISEGIRPGSTDQFRSSGLPTNEASASAGLPQADPLEQEAQAAIQAGADPNAVRQRIQQMRASRG